MRRANMRVGRWAGALMIAGLLVACASPRAGGPDAGAGKVTALVGEVVVAREGAARQPLGMESRVFSKDRVATRAESRAEITLADRSLMTLGEQSEVEIQEARFSVVERVRNILVRLLGTGTVRLATSADAGAKGPVSLSAGLASVTFSGTEVVIVVTAERTAVASLAGTVRVRSMGPALPGEVELRAGQGTDIVAGAAPTTPALWGAARLERVKQATRRP